MYLIDTDHIIDYLKGKEGTVNLLQSLFSEGLYISIISVAEIYEGIEGSKNKQRTEESFEDFLEGAIVLSINKEVCKKFGEIRNDLRKRGELIGDFDILIASTAITSNLQIITDNKSHFSKIKEARIWKG